MQSLISHRIAALPQQDALDPARIGAITTALAVHVVAAALLLAPSSIPYVAAHRPPPISIVPMAAPPPPPPAIEPIPVREVPPTPRPVAPPAKVQAKPLATHAEPIAGNTDTAQGLATPAGSAAMHAGEGGTAEPAAPPAPAPLPPAIPEPPPAPVTGVNLATAVSPAPPYPRAAMLAGIEGTVVLEVEVDAQGMPTAVTVRQGSGNRELDRAAREQVLHRWRFHPAMRNGQAVAASGRVRVSFTLAQ